MNDLCVSDSEERDHGVGTGVNDTMLLETLQFVGLTETTSSVFRFRKTP